LTLVHQTHFVARLSAYTCGMADCMPLDCWHQLIDG